jgi:hypothetical protein
VSDQYSAEEFALAREFDAIRRGYGKPGVVKHYLAAHKLIWPEDDQHRWFVLGLTRICENKVTVFLGAASTNKTYLFTVHALINFWVFPQTSLGILSTTDIISLERKVWGRLKKMFNRGRERFSWLEGFVLDSKRQITPDDIDDENEVARTLDHGIGTVACVSNGRFVGMGKFQGSKPPNSPGKNDGIMVHYGDEAAVMESSFLDAYANWMVNDGFKGVMGGNPTDISDPLCTAAEPRGGWDSFIDTGKTQEWTSRWYDAHVVAFDGRDTPNNDEPKNRYPYLITQKFIDLMASTHGLDSWQYFQQAIGKPSHGMVSNRVITIGLCEKHHAFESAAWKGTARTKLFSCDPAFGGGDRCVGGECEFGEDKDGNIIFAVGTPEIIPIRLNCGIEPEDQIAEFIFNQHKRLNIPPENFFYDSFGRGTLGNSFAKKFGSTCPIPVDSGAPTTERPVRFDLFIDEKNGERRLKTCKEHYSKFVTEMWFSTREAIESNQVRNLSMPVAQEGQLRLFRIVAGNKVEVESKDDMKERVKKSPDLYDYFAIALEGARRLGFRIERIGREVQSSKPDEDYFDKEVKEWDAAINAGLLKH